MRVSIDISPRNPSSYLHPQKIDTLPETLSRDELAIPGQVVEIEEIVVAPAEVIEPREVELHPDPVFFRDESGSVTYELYDPEVTQHIQDRKEAMASYKDAPSFIGKDLLRYNNMLTGNKAPEVYKSRFKEYFKREEERVRGDWQALFSAVTLGGVVKQLIDDLPPEILDIFGVANDVQQVYLESDRSDRYKVAQEIKESGGLDKRIATTSTEDLLRVTELYRDYVMTLHREFKSQGIEQRLHSDFEAKLAARRDKPGILPDTFFENYKRRGQLRSVEISDPLEAVLRLQVGTHSMNSFTTRVLWTRNTSYEELLETYEHEIMHGSSRTLVSKATTAEGVTTSDIRTSGLSFILFKWNPAERKYDDRDRRRWLNEAVTEYAAQVFRFGRDYTSGTFFDPDDGFVFLTESHQDYTYRDERTLLSLLCRKDLTEADFLNAYFEDYNPQAVRGERNPAHRALYEKIHRLYGPGLLGKIDTIMNRKSSEMTSWDKLKQAALLIDRAAEEREEFRRQIQARLLQKFVS